MDCRISVLVEEFVQKFEGMYLPVWLSKFSLPTPLGEHQTPLGENEKQVRLESRERNGTKTTIILDRKSKTIDVCMYKLMVQRVFDLMTHLSCDKLSTIHAPSLIHTAECLCWTLVQLSRGLFEVFQWPPITEAQNYLQTRYFIY